MNRGDANTIILNINVNTQPIPENFADEIELTFNPQNSLHSVRKTKKDGTIIWNDELNKFTCYLSQEDTYKLLTGSNTWQIRLLKDNMVMSTILGDFALGAVNSKEVLTQ